MDNINEYLKRNYSCISINGVSYPDITKAIQCNDGYQVSVQASAVHYCEPGENKAWPYSAVELGFPNNEDELINNFAEDPDNLTNTVYGYVPIEIVNELIEKHGGINTLY